MMRNFKAWLHSLAWISLWVCAVMFLFASWVSAITYQYDELNRLKKVDYGNGASIIYEYDAAGNITAVQYVGLPTESDSASDSVTGPKSKRTGQPDGSLK